MHVQPRSRLARNMCFLDVTVSSYRVSLWSGYGSGAYIFVVGATSNEEREGIFERIPPHIAFLRALAYPSAVPKRNIFGPFSRQLTQRPKHEMENS